jgi:E3 ubiquitin-protein ligase RFWD2
MEPVATYLSHPKAVSYVRFFSASEMLSASTDCTLRSWNTPASTSYSLLNKTEIFKNCNQQFQGHKNEKNFVGLDISKCGNYIATGSEDNSLYIYSKELTQPWIVTSFGPPNPFRVYINSRKFLY